MLGVQQGSATALSADGNTAVVGGSLDNDVGAVWVFQRSAGVWNQVGDKLVGTGGVTLIDEQEQGSSVAISADGKTILVGALGDNQEVGAAWVFTALQPSATTLSSLLNPSLYGQAVTFTATVTSGAHGTVTFQVDGVSQPAVPLNGSTAKFTISSLSPGSHTISAAYSGDATFAASTGNVVNQTVSPLGVISLWANTVVALSGSTHLPVSLAKPAPSAGLTIYLTSSDPATVTVPPSVFIPGGRTAPSVQPLVNGVNLGKVSVTAAAPGYTPDSQSVRVTARLGFARCCVGVYSGTTGSAVLTLSSPAPSGGLTVNLVSDNSQVARVPASVTFPPMATSVSVPITGLASGATLIHASLLPNLADVSIKVTVP